MHPPGRAISKILEHIFGGGGKKRLSTFLIKKVHPPEKILAMPMLYDIAEVHACHAQISVEAVTANLSHVCISSITYNSVC